MRVFWLWIDSAVAAACIALAIRDVSTWSAVLHSALAGGLIGLAVYWATETMRA